MFETTTQLSMTPWTKKRHHPPTTHHSTNIDYPTSCGSGHAMPNFRIGVVQVMKVWFRTAKDGHGGTVQRDASCTGL